MNRIVESILQMRFRDLPEMARYIARTPIVFSSKLDRTCPICGFRGRFVATGRANRPEAVCPKCKSAERHRLLFLALTDGGNRLAAKDVLHFAPEPFVRARLASEARRYVTADLRASGVDLHLDITRTNLPDRSFDVIICNHVLEHIPNDRAALIELLRILRPSGTAYLTVPMADGWRHTFEDVSISTEEERLRHFGQGDHVRWYGRDFPERLSAVGFIVDEFRPPYRDYAEYGLAPGDVVFIARKNKSS